MGHVRSCVLVFLCSYIGVRWKDVGDTSACAYAGGNPWYVLRYSPPFPPPREMVLYVPGWQWVQDGCATHAEAPRPWPVHYYYYILLVAKWWFKRLYSGFHTPKAAVTYSNVILFLIGHSLGRMESVLGSDSILKKGGECDI